MEFVINSTGAGYFIQVINLARRPDRLARIRSELEAAGLAFDIQVAVDGQRDAADTTVLSKGEIATWKSHINAMLTLEKSKLGFSLVLEDDATLLSSLSSDSLDQLIEVMLRHQLDILQIGFIEHIYLIYRLRGFVDFLSSIKQRRRKKDSLTGVKFIAGEFRAGAHAYIVSSRAAQMLSNHVPEPPLMAWDTFLGFLAISHEYMGNVKMARLTKSKVAQASRKNKSSLIDSDVATK